MSSPLFLAAVVAFITNVALVAMAGWYAWTMSGWRLRRLLAAQKAAQAAVNTLRSNLGNLETEHQALKKTEAEAASTVKKQKETVAQCENSRTELDLLVTQKRTQCERLETEKRSLLQRIPLVEAEISRLAPEAAEKTEMSSRLQKAVNEVTAIKVNLDNKRQELATMSSELKTIDDKLVSVQQCTLTTEQAFKVQSEALRSLTEAAARTDAALQAHRQLHSVAPDAFLRQLQSVADVNLQRLGQLLIDERDAARLERDAALLERDAARRTVDTFKIDLRNSASQVDGLLRESDRQRDEIIRLSGEKNRQLYENSRLSDENNSCRSENSRLTNEIIRRDGEIGRLMVTVEILTERTRCARNTTPPNTTPPRRRYNPRGMSPDGCPAYRGNVSPSWE